MDSPEDRQPPNVITSDTENATIVKPNEAPADKQSKFRKFRAYNRGTWNGPKRENKEVIYHQDNLHRYDSIASSLDLNEYQRKRGRKVIGDLDFREIGCPVDHLLFGLCVLVANSDVHDGSRYHPHPDAGDDYLFESVADSMELSDNQQNAAIEKVRYRTNF